MRFKFVPGIRQLRMSMIMMYIVVICLLLMRMVALNDMRWYIAVRNLRNDLYPCRPRKETEKERP